MKAAAKFCKSSRTNFVENVNYKLSNMPPKKPQKPKNDEQSEVVENNSEEITEENIDAKLAEMEKHETFLRKKQKLADLEKSIRKLSMTTTKESGMNSLRKRAEKLLHDGGSATETESSGTSTDYDTEETSPSSQSTTDTESDSSTKRRKTARRKHRKGGKIPTNVSFLRYQYKARKLKYRDLDLPLLLACELEDLKRELKKSVKSRIICHKL